MIDVKTEPPPHYSGSSSQLPKTFPIGPHNAQPVVNIAELQAHLRLLGAFSTLRNNVTSQARTDSSIDKESAWVIYVNRAVHRFNTFMGSKWPTEFEEWSEAIIPPLDVLMVLHSYMLSPRVFYEDTVRRTSFFARNIAAIGSFPISLAASLIDEKTLYSIPPSPEREAFFMSIVQEPFICPLSTLPSDTLSLSCPCCDTLVSSVPWVTDKETGFAQPNFAFGCPSCKKQFTKPMLGIRRFADEITRRRANRRVYLAETLLDPKFGNFNDSVADMTLERLLRRLIAVYSLPKKCEEERISTEALALASGLKWSPDLLAEHLQIGLMPKTEFKPDQIIPRVQRVVAAYSLPGPASLDLVGAVLRQTTFIDKMTELGWTGPGYMPLNRLDSSLARAVLRYHAFLDLMSQTSHDFYVPTLDIDLAWHTHLLKGATYREETFKLLDRIPNHDDTVSQMALQTGYDATAKAWKARFGVPYSICGYMPDSPPENIQEKTKSRFKKMLVLGPKPATAAVTKVQRTGPHPELLATDLEDADSSHPSDHNLHRKAGGQTIVNPEAVGRELASKELAKKILTAPISKDVDEWRKLQAERKRARVDHREAFTGADDEERYPYWGASATVPLGFWAACDYDNVSASGTPGIGYNNIGLGRDSNWMPSVPYA